MRSFYVCKSRRAFACYSGLSAPQSPCCMSTYLESHHSLRPRRTFSYTVLTQAVGPVNIPLHRLNVLNKSDDDWQRTKPESGGGPGGVIGSLEGSYSFSCKPGRREQTADMSGSLPPNPLPRPYLIRQYTYSTMLWVAERSGYPGSRPSPPGQVVPPTSPGDLPEIPLVYSSVIVIKYHPPILVA